MLRKWTVLALSMCAVAGALTGLSVAAQDPSLEKIMEKVNSKNLVITKATRTKVAFAKDQAKIADAAKELVKLGKESRSFKDPAEKQKKSQDDWTKMVDDFVTKSEALVEVTGKSGFTLEQAKKSHTAVKASCTNCHEIFKTDEK